MPRHERTASGGDERENRSDRGRRRQVLNETLWRRQELMAFAAESGLPLFIRRASVGQSVPESPMELQIQLDSSSIFFGIHQFSQLNGCELKLARSTGSRTKIRWKRRDQVLLIVHGEAVDGVTETDLDSLLDLILKAIHLTCDPKTLVGEDFDQQRHDLKLAIPLVDHIMHCFVTVDQLDHRIGSVDYVPIERTKPVNAILSYINKMESVQFWAMFMQGKLATANKEWWSVLAPSPDAFLVSCLVNSLRHESPPSPDRQSAIRKLTVFLPHIAPNSPNRLILTRLTRNVTLCLMFPQSSSHEHLETELTLMLKNLRLQEEKTLDEITIMNPRAIIQSQVPEMSGFVLFNAKFNIHFVYNRKAVQEYMEEIILFCAGNGHEEEYLVADRIILIKSWTKNRTGICVIFARHADGKLSALMARTQTLLNIFSLQKNTTNSKLNHFWP